MQSISAGYTIYHHYAGAIFFSFLAYIPTEARGALNNQFMSLYVWADKQALATASI